MRLVSKTDIEAPAPALFAAMTDLVWLEDMARRGRVVLERTDRGEGLAIGASWRASFTFRQRPRQAESMIERFDPPKVLRLGGRVGSYGFTIEPTLAPLSRTLTRLSVSIEVKPHSVGARLMLQTLRLGRSRLQARLDRRVEQIAKALAERVGRA